MKVPNPTEPEPKKTSHEGFTLRLNPKGHKGHEGTSILVSFVSFGVHFPSDRGRAKVNELPIPSTLSTQMRPPCSSTIPLAMDRPRPMPSKRRVRLGST